MVSRILETIKSKGLSINAVEKALGFGNGAIKRFETSSPSIDKIIKLSNFLNVSLEWLVTGKEPTPQSSVSDDSIANDATVKLVMQLDPFDKAEIRGMARQMLTAPKYQEEDDGYYIGRVAGFGGLPQEIKVPKENHDEIIRLTEKIIAEQNKKDMKRMK